MDGIFETPGGESVPAVTAEEMREVDRVTVEEIGLPLLSMMENAGRSLALEVYEHLDDQDEADQGETGQDDGPSGSVAVLAGGGGNGGGGLCCARHLANRGLDVRVVLDRDPDDLEGASAAQWQALRATDATTTASHDLALDGAVVAVDAIFGYGLQGAPRGRASVLIGALDSFSGWTLSVDLPSGLDATTGERPGIVVAPDRTMTLALPKPGLTEASGELVLADLAIPALAFEQAGIEYEPPFEGGYRVPLWAP